MEKEIAGKANRLRGASPASKCKPSLERDGEGRGGQGVIVTTNIKT